MRSSPPPKIAIKGFEKVLQLCFCAHLVDFVMLFWHNSLEQFLPTDPAHCFPPINTELSLYSCSLKLQETSC